MQDNILQTAERAMIILELLGEETLTATQIAQKMALNKTTVHRLMMTLLSRGFVERNEETGLYQIGLKLVELSSIRLNKIELKTEASPYMRQLANKVNQSVQLAIYDNNEAVYIDKIEKYSSIRLYSQIGKRIPIYCSAIGKALMLDKSDVELEAVLSAQNYHKFTPTTLESKSAVLAEIHKGQQTGYTVDNEEHELGIFCLAAPIYDYRGHIIAAISTAGFDSKTIKEVPNEVLLNLNETAIQISKRMGYNG